MRSIKNIYITLRLDIIWICGLQHQVWFLQILMLMELFHVLYIKLSSDMTMNNFIYKYMCYDVIKLSVHVSQSFYIVYAFKTKWIWVPWIFNKNFLSISVMLHCAFQTFSTSKEKENTNIPGYLWVDPQETNHNIKFICSFMSYSKIFMWVLHPIPQHILAGFNKIWFKLFTICKNSPYCFGLWIWIYCIQNKNIALEMKQSTFSVQLLIESTGP